MHKLFEIVIYTASLSIYADPLLDELDPNNYASYRLFREHCTQINNVFVKDLAQLGRDMKDIIFVDNSPASYALQPENAIPILTWLDDQSDNKLYQLAPVLELLSKFQDVRPAIKKIVKDDKINYLQAFKVLRAEEDKEHSDSSPDQSPTKENSTKKLPLVDGWVSNREYATIAAPSDSPLRKSQTNSKRDDGCVSQSYGTSKPLMQMLSPPPPQAFQNHGVAAQVPKRQTPDLIPNTPQYKGNPLLGQNKPTISKSKPNILYSAYPDADAIIKKLDSEKQEKFEKQQIGKRPASSAACVHLDDTENSGKKPLPHHQPRQTPKGKSEIIIRPSTPQTNSGIHIAEISGKKIANPTQSNKQPSFYSNLIKVKTEGRMVLTTKVEKKNTEKSLSKPQIITNTGSLGMSSKKSNKHSSSMGNADWLAGYDKIKKELNFNSPRELNRITRTNTGTTRSKDGRMVFFSETKPKKTEYSRPLLKPGKNSQIASQNSLVPRVDSLITNERRTPCSKYSPGELLKFHVGGEGIRQTGTLQVEKTKFTQMLLQMNEGKAHPLISSISVKNGGTRIPVIASHNNNFG